MTGSEDSGHDKAAMGEKGQVEEIVVEVLDEDSQGQSSNITKEEERRLVRKLDRRIMPMLAAMYLFASASLCLFAYTVVLVAEADCASSS